MSDIKRAIGSALGEIEGAEAFFYYPQSFARLPCVSFYEAANVPAAGADDRAYAAEIVYAVDVWAETDAQAEGVAAHVAEKMGGLGFAREFSCDMYDPGSDVRHKAMRFKTIR